MIAGEASGDILAAGLIRELKVLFPDAQFEGIGGKHMIAEGFNSMEDINELSVMGLVEVLKHLPALLKIKRNVLTHFFNNLPDVFIGIDAPDFNLPIETKLKQRGVSTVHYVSPTIWAWREKRIHKIAKATHLVLGIFPFEAKHYEKYAYPYRFVGHTMADEIPMEPDRAAARDALNIPREKLVLAILPGSRAREIDTLLDTFLATAALFGKSQQTRELQVFIPAVNQDRKAQIQEILAVSNVTIEVNITQHPAREVMIASDVVLLASGTASLECMLCKRPMVVAYLLSFITHKMMQKLYLPKYFSLPNILADEPLVPEFLQEDVNPENLCRHLNAQLNENNAHVLSRFRALHQQLRCDASKQAALAISELIKTKADQ
ncbi:MAG: lipid-A-disaccharide synthase [Pseudomonadota bacterium]